MTCIRRPGGCERPGQAAKILGGAVIRFSLLFDRRQQFTHRANKPRGESGPVERGVATPSGV